MEIVVSNIPKKSKIDLNKWAQYTIEKWQFAVSKYKLRDTGNLINSFTSQIHQDANGSKAMISFAFEYYLRMIDMGVGSGTKYEERADQYAKNRAYGKGTGTKRRRYPVYNKIFYAEINRLSELYQIYYRNSATNILAYATD